MTERTGSRARLKVRVAIERARLLTYLPDARATAQLHRLLRPLYALISCESVQDVERELSGQLYDCIIIDRMHKDGSSTMVLVRLLRRRYPSVAIIVYCEPAPVLFREIVEFSRAGIHDVVLRGADDLRSTLRRTVAAAAEAALSEYTIAALEPVLSPQLKNVVTICLAQRESRLDVTGLASALGVTRKTLSNWSRNVGAPGPEALIGWGRVVRAARLLQDPGRSVETIAHTMMFGSGSALTNMFRRYLGESPTAVRGNGGVKRVVEKWAEAFKRPPTNA